MKTAFTLAVLGALASTPALAQEMQQGEQGGMAGPQAGPSSEQPGTSAEKQGAIQHPETLSQRQATHRETVRSAQEALHQKGYKVGKIDGRMGPETRHALERFQRDQGLHANGRLDRKTMAALGVEPSAQQAETPEKGGMQKQQPPQGPQGQPPQ
ncbi:MAG: peptidoglycan-binding domain-containing protein [Magnetospirillum sp.]|nr:peptidoglycan-binding domain-containing protein [Magnetospirillum sp.]